MKFCLMSLFVLIFLSHLGGCVNQRLSGCMYGEGVSLDVGEAIEARGCFE